METTQNLSSQSSPATPSVETNGPKYARFTYRYAASILDQLILLVLMIPLLLIGFLIQGMKIEGIDSIFNILFGLMGVGYSVYFLHKDGATLGKKFFKVQVQSLDGAPIGWGKAILRELLGKFLSSIVLSIGYVWMLFDSKKQTWHDKLAKTIVIQREPLSKGRNFFAYFLAYGLVIIAILGIGAVAVLVSINPSEQLARSRDSGRIAAVTQIGHALQSYATRNNASYPMAGPTWGDLLVTSGDLSNVPSAMTYSSSSTSCHTNLINETWCYGTNATDTIVFASLESKNYKSKCQTGKNRAYILFSEMLGRGGVVCSATDPVPASSYSFVP